MSRTKDQRTLDQLLQDVADILFPAEDPPPRIELDSADPTGDTPLHVYLWRSDDFAARKLIECGADVNAVGDMGETPLHVAVQNADAKTIAALLAAGARESVVSEFEQTPELLAKDIGRLSVFKEGKALARGLCRGHMNRRTD